MFSAGVPTLTRMHRARGPMVAADVNLAAPPCVNDGAVVGPAGWRVRSSLRNRRLRRRAARSWLPDQAITFGDEGGDVAAQVIEIVQRGDCDGGGDGADVVEGRRGAPDPRHQRVREDAVAHPEAGQAGELAQGAEQDDVWVGIGQIEVAGAAELGIGLVDRDEASTLSMMRAISSFRYKVPVGLLGLQTMTSLVRSLTAAMMPSTSSANPGAGPSGTSITVRRGSRTGCGRRRTWDRK